MQEKADAARAAGGEEGLRALSESLCASQDTSAPLDTPQATTAAALGSGPVTPAPPASEQYHHAHMHGASTTGAVSNTSAAAATPADTLECMHEAVDNVDTHSRGLTLW